jgi:hypothetical protein
LVADLADVQVLLVVVVALVADLVQVLVEEVELLVKEIMEVLPLHQPIHIGVVAVVELVQWVLMVAFQVMAVQVLLHLLQALQ